jgi:hypothetical protein
MVALFLSVTNSINKMIWDKIKKAKNYREFLAFYFEIRKITASTFARSADCHRGFPLDVISGKRRLTSKSSLQFEKALKLPVQGKKLFKYLVAAEESDTYLSIPRLNLIEKIDQLRHQSWEPTKTVDSNSKIIQLLKNDKIPTIFAATGNAKDGANIEEIQSRTRFERSTLESLLKKMCDFQILYIKNNRYFSDMSHFSVLGSQKNEIILELFQKQCSMTSATVKSNWNSDNHLFFASKLCVRENQMPELKKALKETLLQFVDESLDENGDSVAHLLLGFHLA